MKKYKYFCSTSFLGKIKFDYDGEKTLIHYQVLFFVSKKVI